MRMIKYSENELIPDIIIDFDEWNNHSGIYLIIEKAAKHTLSYINNIEYKELSILLTSNKNITALNKRFRDINKATNILSFKSEKPHLGDIVISYEYILAELTQQSKTLNEHLSHLIIHGILHLLDFDHENDEKAAEMEKIEINIMNDLGYKNPYLLRG